MYFLNGKKKKGGGIFVKVKTLHTKISYKVAIVDMIQLSGMRVFLTRRNRWNFKLLVKKAWVGGGGWVLCPESLKSSWSAHPDMWALAGIPEGSQLLKAHTSG